MDYDWGPKKADENIAKHNGITFESVERFDWSSALEREDPRHYGEVRWQALGWIDGVLHCLIYTDREPDITRGISLRKATPKERKNYAQARP